MLQFILLQLGGAGEAAAHFSRAVETFCTVLIAVFALVTALKVYNKWQLGQLQFSSVDYELVGWFGSLFFFVLAKAFIHWYL